MIRIIGNKESAVSVRIRPYDTIPLDTTRNYEASFGSGPWLICFRVTGAAHVLLKRKDLAGATRSPRVN